MACWGQTSTQLPHLRHLTSLVIISGYGSSDSGLEHHQQRRGHPFKKIVVLMPGPSWIENRCTLNTNPLPSAVPLSIIRVHDSPQSLTKEELTDSASLYEARVCCGHPPLQGQGTILTQALLCPGDDTVLNLLSLTHKIDSEPGKSHVSSLSLYMSILPSFRPFQSHNLAKSDILHSGANPIECN